VGRGKASITTKNVKGGRITQSGLTKKKGVPGKNPKINVLGETIWEGGTWEKGRKKIK